MSAKQNAPRITLGIETSCDDTAIGIYHESDGLLAHSRQSQTIHDQFGGVVPELAARDHINAIEYVLSDALSKASITLDDITGVGFTQGPGLAGSLLVGSSFGRSLAWGLNIPSIGIHHLEAHLLAPFLEQNEPQFPFLALLVSGGHTMLIDVQSLGRYRILGQSLDDAAGEAFDKTAKLLNLGYPGGPLIEARAQEGDPTTYALPRPLLDKDNLDFSFSGLKTAVANLIAKEQPIESEIITNNIAASFQQAVMDTLVGKTEKALCQGDYNHLVISGGVGANQALRTAFDTMANNNGVVTYYPRLEYCTDNGAMVAIAAHLRLNNQGGQDLGFGVLPRWPLSELAVC